MPAHLWPPINIHLYKNAYIYVYIYVCECAVLPNCNHFNDAESSAMNALVNLRLNFCVGFLLIKLSTYIDTYISTICNTIHICISGMEFAWYVFIRLYFHV